MPPTTAVHTIGFYCGRHGSGFFDEPQNSFSNAAFLIGALLAYRAWRESGSSDKFLVVWVLMLAAIGIGSFVFHSFPSPATLYVDRVPIQVYTLAVVGCQNAQDEIQGAQREDQAMASTHKLPRNCKAAALPTLRGLACPEPRRTPS